MAEVEKIYGTEQASAGSSNQGQAPALAQAGPNYDVAATSEPDYNYSSAEAVAADSQYVDVEPTYTFTPTTVPAATQVTPAQQHQRRLNNRLQHHRLAKYQKACNK